MAVTLQQLRARVRTKLRETADDTHFTDDVLNSYINESIEFTAVFIEFPRDLVRIAAEEDTPNYTLPADNMIVKTAYFGNPSVSGDVKPLEVLTEETLAQLVPNWLDETISSQGRPLYLIVLDKNTISVYPRPNSAEGVSGKWIFLNYVYDPDPITQNSQTPDLPPVYHSILQFYVLHLCYLTLANGDMSTRMFNEYMGKVKLIKPATTKETAQAMFFAWGSDINVGERLGEYIIPQ